MNIHLRFSYSPGGFEPIARIRFKRDQPPEMRSAFHRAAQEVRCKAAGVVVVSSNMANFCKAGTTIPKFIINGCYKPSKYGVVYYCWKIPVNGHLIGQSSGSDFPLPSLAERTWLFLRCSWDTNSCGGFILIDSIPVLWTPKILGLGSDHFGTYVSRFIVDGFTFSGVLICLILVSVWAMILLILQYYQRGKDANI